MWHLVVTGLVTGFAGLFVGMLLAGIGFGVMSMGEGFDFGPGGMGGTYGVDSLATRVAPGDCLSGFDLTDAGTAQLACEQGHDLEVFARRAALDGEGPVGYPGNLQFLGDEMCIAAFEPYVANPYDSSSLYSDAYVPDTRAWAAGERDVVCVLSSMDSELLTGSAEGSGL